MDSESVYRTAVVLAAGKGTRMKSPNAKVLHPLMGRPMIVHLLEELSYLEIDATIVVVGHQRERLEPLIAPFGVTTVVQEPQLGTGHALMCCRETLQTLPPGEVLLVAGDVPLLPVEEIGYFWDEFTDSDALAALITLELEHPAGYGRVITSGSGAVKRVVEEKDAVEGQKDITTVNSGVYFLRTPEILPLLEKITTDNAQGEFYLPDIFQILYEQGRAATAFEAEDPYFFLGINTQIDLARANRELQEDIVTRWMYEGVTIIDPDTAWIEETVELSPGVTLQPFVRLCGKTTLGPGVEVRSYTTITDSEIGDGSTIKENCVIEGTTIGPRCSVGPFCHTREGTTLEEGAKLGNFVETKKARLGKGVKASHLSYLGDAEIGAGSNIGAGTITCNYDGEKKHPTVLGERVFIGSDTQLVAPVKVGEGAYVGAGTTVTKDVPPGALAVSRVDQKNIEGWVERKKKKQMEKKEKS